MRKPQSFVFQAIETRYYGPTNRLPGRIKAQAGGGRKDWKTWDHSLGVNENHRAAAESLAQSLGWLDNGEALVMGSLDKSSVFVILAKGDC